jgi:hypothetical protein
VETIVPIVIDLKRKLESAKSPLIDDLVNKTLLFDGI